MIKRIRNKKALIAFILTVFLLISFISSCNNFMSGDDDLKAAIEDEVLIANAEEVTITVRAENDSMGTTSPLGATTVKVGVPFNITTTTNSEFAFLNWMQIGGNSGDITFANEASKETTATVNKKTSSLEIRAMFDTRPYVVSTSPFDNEQDVIITRPVKITFSRPIDINTATEENILIKRRLSGSSSDPESINHFFKDPELNGSVLTLALESGSSLGSSDAFYEVFITVLQQIEDLNGNTMTAGKTVRFVTSKEEDTTAPSIGDITVKNTGGAALPVNNPTNSRSVLINFDAGDDSGATDLRALITDDLSNILYDDTHTNNIPVTLADIDGTRTISAKIFDPSGNDSLTKTASIILDRQPPNTPAFTSLPAALTNSPLSFDVTGADNGDSGIKEFKVTAGATTTPSSAAGSFTNIIPEAQGNNTITIVAVDNAGNTSSAPLSSAVFYDSVVPGQPTITSPPAATTNAPVSLTVSATDASPSSLIANYRITGGATGVPITSATGAFTNVTPAAQGNNTLTIVAVDNAGNTGTERTTSVFYDSEAPVVTNFGIGTTARTDNYTTSTNLKIWADIDDISNVQAAFSESAAGPWNYNDFESGTTSYTFTNVQGPLTLYARFKDAPGNETAIISDEITRDSVNPDPPTITVAPTSPTKNLVSLTVSANDTAPSSGIKEYRITAGATGVPIASVNGVFTNITPAAQGSNTFTIVAVDNAGNVSGSLSSTVFYDTVIPGQPTITVAPTTPTKDPVSFTVSATDSSPSSLIANYRITGGATGVPITSATGAFSNITPAAQGNNTLTIVAVDNAGNTGTERTTSVFYDSEAPVVTNFGIGTTARTDNYTTSTNLKIWADIDDISNVQAAFSESAAGPWNYNDFESGTTSYTFTNVQGPLTLYARFKDAPGNETAIISDEITRDSVNPDPPTITVAPTSPTKNLVSLTVSANDTAPSSGIKEYRITAGATGVPIASVNGVFTNITPAAQGSNTFTIVAVDNAGNVSGSLSSTVFYDTVIPGQPTITVAPTTPTKDPVSFTVSATDSSPSSLIANYRITGGAVGVPITSATGTFSNITPAAQGSNTFTIVAVDNAGNTGAERTTSVFYDSEAPVVTTLTNGGVDEYVKDGDANITFTATFNETLDGSPTIKITNGLYPASDISIAMTNVSGNIYRYIWDIPNNPGAVAAVSFTAKDTIGNETTSATVDSGITSYTIDNTEPAIGTPTVTRSGDNPVLTIPLSTSDLSGVNMIYYWAGTGTKAAAGGNVKTYPITTPVTSGNIVTSVLTINRESFRFTLEDTSGNETTNGYSMIYTPDDPLTTEVDEGAWTFGEAAARSSGYTGNYIITSISDNTSATVKNVTKRYSTHRASQSETAISYSVSSQIPVKTTAFKKDTKSTVQVASYQFDSGVKAVNNVNAVPEIKEASAGGNTITQGAKQSVPAVNEIIQVSSPENAASIPETEGTVFDNKAAASETSEISASDYFKNHIALMAMLLSAGIMICAYVYLRRKHLINRKVK